MAQRQDRRIVGASEAMAGRAAELFRFWTVFALTWCAAYGLGIWSALSLMRAMARPLFTD